MSVHIRNVSNGLVSVQLNSGDTLHLAPGELSGELEQFEVGDSYWVQLLRDRGRVTLEPSAAEPRGGRERRHAKNGEPSVKNADPSATS
jgi:hypothetical protein